MPRHRPDYPERFWSRYTPRTDPNYVNPYTNSNSYGRAWAFCPSRGRGCDGNHATGIALSQNTASYIYRIEGSGRLRCPQTGQCFIYCSSCGWRRVPQEQTFTLYPVTYSGRLYCEGCARRSHLRRCRSCRVVSPIYNYYAGLCGGCRANRIASQVPPRTPTPACNRCLLYNCDCRSPRLCSTCNTPAIHLDALTERYICSHRAAELIRQEIPVRLMGELTAV